jgi:hypothetical protein
LHKKGYLLFIDNHVSIIGKPLEATMTSVSSALPKLFRWAFTVLVVLAALGATAITLAILIDPKLPAGTHFGPMTVDLLGQPGTVVLRAANGDSDFTATALHGSVILFVEKAGGLIEVLKHYGLPLVLVNMIFFVVLFDLLRRLFRNVGRGDSFTPQTIRLVQYLGGLLILFSLVSAFAEHWFSQAVIAYLAQHTVVTVSGTPLHLPVPQATVHGFPVVPHLHGFPFGSSLFFSGLLVLALSEVFRQGLALKNENDLTV